MSRRTPALQIDRKLPRCSCFGEVYDGVVTQNDESKRVLVLDLSPQVRIDPILSPFADGKLASPPGVLRFRPHGSSTDGRRRLTFEVPSGVRSLADGFPPLGAARPALLRDLGLVAAMVAEHESFADRGRLFFNPFLCPSTLVKDGTGDVHFLGAGLWPRPESLDLNEFPALKRFVHPLYIEESRILGEQIPRDAWKRAAFTRFGFGVMLLEAATSREAHLRYGERGVALGERLDLEEPWKPFEPIIRKCLGLEPWNGESLRESFDLAAGDSRKRPHPRVADDASDALTEEVLVLAGFSAEPDRTSGQESFSTVSTDTLGLEEDDPVFEFSLVEERTPGRKRRLFRALALAAALAVGAGFAWWAATNAVGSWGGGAPPGRPAALATSHDPDSVADVGLVLDASERDAPSASQTRSSNGETQNDVKDVVVPSVHVVSRRAPSSSATPSLPSPPPPKEPGVVSSKQLPPPLATTLLIFASDPSATEFLWTELPDLPSRDKQVDLVAARWSRCEPADAGLYDELIGCPSPADRALARFWKLTVRSSADRPVVALLGGTESDVELRYLSTSSGEELESSLTLTSYVLHELWTEARSGLSRASTSTHPDSPERSQR